MDLLEPGGRKFVELGSGSPPEEEGADAAITPETLSQSPHLKKAWSLFSSLSLSLSLSPTHSLSPLSLSLYSSQQNLSFFYIQDDKCGSLAEKKDRIHRNVQHVF